MTDDDHRWHLDKKVPIALIIMLGAHIGAFLVYAGHATARLDQIEKTQGRQAELPDRLTRVESKVDAIKETLGDLQRSLRWISQREGEAPPQEPRTRRRPATRG